MILSKPIGFPQIPAPRKNCQSMTVPPDKRNGQYVMCPEQDCECLVYYGDQNRSMIDVLGLGQDPFWDDRVKDFYGWYNKSASKTGQDAWTWEGKDNQKWSSTRCAFKRNQSVPANPADRTNPQEKAAPWRDTGPLDMDPSFLYPGSPTDPECPVPQNDYLCKEHQQLYMQWIEQILAHCALPSMLHFAVPELKSMEGVASPTGLELNTSVPSKHPGSLIYDGEQMRPSLMSTFPHSVLKVQAKINNQCVQPQL